MKSSIIRSLVIFAAGAGSATVVAGLYPPIEPKSPEQLLEDGMKLLPQVERFGSYVGVIKDGRIGITASLRQELRAITLRALHFERIGRAATREE